MTKIKNNKKLIKLFYPVALTAFSIPMIIACSSEKVKIIDDNIPEPSVPNALLVITKANSNNFVLTLTNVQKYEGQTLEVYIKTLNTAEFIINPQRILVPVGENDVVITIQGLNPNTDYAIKIITAETLTKSSEDVYLIESIKTSKEEIVDSGAGTNGNTTTPSKPNQGSNDGEAGNANSMPIPEPSPEPSPNPNPGTGSGATTNPTPMPEPSPEPDPVPVNASQLQKLLNEVDSILKVKFNSETQKTAAKIKVQNFFDRIASGAPSNDDIKWIDGNTNYLNELKRKVGTSLIKNNLNINDPQNYLDVSQLQRFDDSKFEVFNFLSENQNMTMINQTFQNHQDFFKALVYERTDSYPLGYKYGSQVWDKRVSWPSMQFGLAFKVNNIDYLAGNKINGKLNTDMHFGNIIFSENNLLKNKIIYISNQIWISIFKSYKEFLNSTDDLNKVKNLANMKTLLQSMFHGKNAKKIFEQFLGKNPNYQINSFLTQIKRKNFGRNEPDYLGNLIVLGNVEKSFENILVYLNYLNYHRELSVIHDDFPLETPGRTYQTDPGLRGGFSFQMRDAKAAYKTKSRFSEISFDDEGRIEDIDFNKYYFDDDKYRS